MGKTFRFYSIRRIFFFLKNFQTFIYMVFELRPFNESQKKEVQGFWGQIECRHCILYPLWLGPSFPNDAEILRLRVDLGLNQILNWLEEC